MISVLGYSFSTAFLHASTSTTLALENGEPSCPSGPWRCWLCSTSWMCFLSSAAHLWSAAFPVVSCWSFVTVCPWPCRVISLSTVVWLPPFTSKIEKKDEGEERKKKSTCWLYWITKPNSMLRRKFLTLRLPPLRLSVFAWSRWLLEPPNPTPCRAHVRHHSVPSTWGEIPG